MRWAAFFSFYALLALACSRGGDAIGAAPPNEPSAVRPASVLPAAASAGKAFGAFCVQDSECAGGVCFHKRIKGADSGPERRDVHPEAEEHDGFCSMRCDSDGDCPVPPTRGKCGARGMCK